jgi:hypothetical protein
MTYPFNKPFPQDKHIDKTAELRARVDELETTVSDLRLVLSNIRLRLPNPPSHAEQNPYADLSFCWAQLRADICYDENYKRDF